MKKKDFNSKVLASLQHSLGGINSADTPTRIPKHGLKATTLYFLVHVTSESKAKAGRGVEPGVERGVERGDKDGRGAGCRAALRAAAGDVQRVQSR